MSTPQRNGRRELINHGVIHKAPSYANAKILLVEDIYSARKHAVRMLTSLGYIVTAAQDAIEAMALIDQGEQFDVAFIDIVIPGMMDGLDLSRAIRARDPNIKILLTSGFSVMTTEDLKQLDASYVAKPFRKKAIAAILKSILAPTQ